LAKNKLAKESELVIGLDYPPQEKYQEGWEKIKEYLPTITGFGKVTILSSDENIGAAQNSDKLRSYVKDLGYDSFILTEDDNVFSKNFLEYINWGLKAFKDDKRMLAVCGFKRVDTSFLTNNVYIYPQFVAWGYGMWFDRREKLEKWTDFSVLEEYVKNQPISLVFTSDVYRMVTVIRMIKNRYILGDSLPSFIPEEERYCLYPAISKVRNTGFDGSGLHCNNISKELTDQYHSLVIDDSSSFTPHINGPLYDIRLKSVYNAVYKRSFSLKRHMKAAISYLVYRIKGKYWRIP
jgi:hypothetical protein